MAIEDEEYVSDPEDAIVPMRRREASDDEEGERSERGRDRAAEIGSDVESDGQEAAPAYEEGEEEEYEEEIYEEDEIVKEEEEKEEIDGEDVGEEEKKDLEGSRREEEAEDGEEKKKENEPYAVPTAGAFYMHDDRFQENGRGRNRRMPGGRRIWESKDDHAWVHDRFEEMNFQDTRYNQRRRNSRGRGGGRTGGTGRTFVKGNRNRGRYGYDYDDNQNCDGSNQNRDGNQNHEQKSVRGRGPRRYEPLPRNEISPSQYKQPAKSHESTSNASIGRPSSQTPNLQPDSGLPKKHAFGSNLNSASPPFYPSGKQDASVTQKRDVQAGKTNMIVSSSMQMENNFLTSQTGSMLRGKAVVDSVGHDRLYIDDSLHSFSANAFANTQMQSSVSLLTSANTTHSSQSKVQGRSSSSSSQTNYQPIASLGQVTRVTEQIQPTAQQRPQAQMHPALRVSTQQMGPPQRPVNGNQISFPSHVSSNNSTELIETDSPPGSSKSKNQLVAKGKTGIQGTGRGSFLYNGSRVIGASGAMGLSHNDQNFSATPALLSVMQFGGQHHGGLGVPAVGMALPGYVAQPQLGFGNSEMTWVPVLAGAAGALGASYPYIALDGNRYRRPPGQTSSAVASRESSASKPVNALKPPQKSEIVNDEFGQRQNKPRRYSEMNFGQ